MPIDARINPAQAAELYRSTANLHSTTKSTGYTKFDKSHDDYHYSWHRDKIVVGMGMGQGYHKNFKCTISDTFQIVLTTDPGAGRLPVGPNGINVSKLTHSVSAALATCFKKSIRTAAFNGMGRTPQRVTLQNTRIVNRFDKSNIVVDAGPTLVTIKPGQSHTFINGYLTGFVVTHGLSDGEIYYRNVDVRENVVLMSGDTLRVMKARPSAPITLTGVVSVDIRVVVI